MELRATALKALETSEIAEKLSIVQHPRHLFAIEIDELKCFPEPQNLPGRPIKPTLFAHIDIPQRSPFTPAGLAALIHAVCHIEFNAINLALDAIWRFGGMPRDYYLDWLKVATEEAQHFCLLREQLRSMGHDYGDFASHTGLWDMVERTKSDVLARMALVPRTLEARGLDATPPMQAKLRKVGTPDALKTVTILDIILREEVGHVAIGNRWYRFLCEARGLDPVTTYGELAARHQAPRLRGPFNLGARRAAGFSEQELTELASATQTRHLASESPTH